MSVFYVGCPVRVIAVLDPVFWGHFLGAEGVIRSANDSHWFVWLRGEEYECAKWAASEFLAPIIPPDLLAGEDINALYEPHITEADIPSEVWQR